MSIARALVGTLAAVSLSVSGCGSETGTGPAAAEPVGADAVGSTTTPQQAQPSLPLVDTDESPTTSATGNPDVANPPTTPTTSSTPASTTTVPSTRTAPTTSIAAVVDWSNVVPATVVEHSDVTRWNGDRTRAWLLRFDDRLTLDVAQGMALEAQSYGIVDSDGALELFATGSWVWGACDDCPDPAAYGGAASLMEFMLVGGLFGDYDPDPVSPSGTRLTVRTFSGVLGDEPPDQIDYLVGSSRLGPMSMWEERIVDELPDLDADEYLAAIAFEHPCGAGPAGSCR